MDDGLLESTKARRDLGPLPPRSVMMIEDGDANDPDVIIWYWLDLYAPGGSHSTRRVRYNRAAAMQDTRGELIGDLSVPRSFTESQRC